MSVNHNIASLVPIKRWRRDIELNEMLIPVLVKYPNRGSIKRVSPLFLELW